MDFVQLVGFAAAFLTTVAFIPQVLKAWKTKSTKDISLPMYCMTCTGLFLWLVYGLLISSWPLIVANVFTFLFALFILALKVKHG